MASKTTTKSAKVSKRQAFANSLSTSNLIALSILIGVLSVLLALVVGKALVGSMMLNARVIGKKSAASKQINANYDALKGLQGEYNALGAMRETVATALPNKPDLPQLWAMMENIGNASGVATTSVNSVSTSDSVAAAGGPVQSLPISVAVQGTYPAIQSYLQNLEASTRPLRVTNITLSGTNNSIQANLTITTYYQGPADLSVGSEALQ